jgi:hypothetical protein
MADHFLQKSRGGTLWIDVVDDPPYVPATNPSAQVALYHPDGTSVLQASGTATVGAATTLGEDASEGDTSVFADAVTGISLGDVLIVGPSTDEKQFEWITVKGIGSDKELEILDALKYGYDDDDALASPRLSLSVSAGAAAVASTRRDALARWEYTINGVKRYTWTTFTVSTWNPRCPITEQDILRRDPRARSRVGSRNDLVMLIEDLWQELLQEMGERIDPGAIVSGSDLATALRYRVLAEIEITAAQTEMHERLFELFRASWDRVLASRPIDVDGSGSISDDDVVSPAWSGRVYRA